MRSFLLVCFCLISVYTTAQPASILHKPYRDQYQFLDSVLEKANAMSVQDGTKMLGYLTSWAEKNNDQQLANELKLETARWSFFHDCAPDIISTLTDLLKVARNDKNTILEAEVLHSYAYVLASKRMYAQAFENYLAAYSIYSKIPGDGFPNKQLFLYELGGAYHHFGDYETAIKYLKEALVAKKVTHTDITKSSYNNIGLAFRNEEKYDSSEKYLRILYELAKQTNDSGWAGIAGGNIGINYYRQKRYDEAIPLLKNDIEISLSTASLRNAVGSINTLAAIYFDQKKYDEAEALALKALSICDEKRFWHDYQIAAQTYTMLFKVYFIKNEADKAAHFADLALKAKDSLTAQSNTLNFTKTREKFAMMEHKMEVEQLNNQKKMEILVRNGLVVLILLLTVIAIMLINRQRLRQKKLEAEKKNAESELVAASMLIDNFRQSVQEKNNIIEHVTNELERMKTGDETEDETELLIRMENAIILTDEQWDNFRQMFEKVHKGFFTRLRKSIPDLTESEIRFLALTKLKLSSKEMASMLGVSLNAIRIYRYRLRKKLNMDKDDMIEALVENI